MLYYNSSEKECSLWGWMGPGGPSGLQNQRGAFRASWVSSILMHSRHKRKATIWLLFFVALYCNQLYNNRDI